MKDGQVYNIEKPLTVRGLHCWMSNTLVLYSQQHQSVSCPETFHNVEYGGSRTRQERAVCFLSNVLLVPTNQKSVVNILAMVCKST